MNDLLIWLSELELLEGCFREFRVDQEANFALEFHPKSVRPVGGGPPMLEPEEPGAYLFCGCVAHRLQWVETGVNGQGITVSRDKAFTTFDVGLLAYCLDSEYGLPSFVNEPGSWWAGAATLCVAWHYYERYARLPGIPPLAYQWRVRRILLDQSPWVTVLDGRGQPCVVRDETRRAFTEVPETVTNGYRQRRYLLDCALLGSPVRARAEAIQPEGCMASRRLAGMDARLQILAREGEPDLPPAEPIPATLVRVSEDEPWQQRGLLRLHRPLQVGERAFEFAVARPRYEGQGISYLATNGRFGCWVEGIAAEAALSPTPLDVHRRPHTDSLAAVLHSPSSGA